ncbi:MAG TPA: adenylate/guanylate cyclase domain-containing protein [Aeromicrobium sp.]|nr:adenylate/guanylate cyclase domain-containing protein [Aeromicrobium sp.]
MAAVGEVRYARSGEVDIAYQTFEGDGRDIVFVPGFISHLDLMWDLPPFAAIHRQLASLGRLTVFDKRGTGLSGRTLGFGSLAERMDDIRVVMDAAGIEKADLYAISEGGPLALLFTATFPDRVSSLCLWGTLVRGFWSSDFPWGLHREVAEAGVEWVQEHWGTGQALAGFIQHVPRSEETQRQLAMYQRSACTPAQVGEILKANLNIDIRSLLSAIRTPCLVMHNRHDPLIPVGQARYIAEHLPNAEYREGEGDFHVAWDGNDMGWMLDQLKDWFSRDSHQPAGRKSSGPAEPESRVLATVLITDLVGSTERATRMGDHAWSEQLDAHDRVSKDAVTVHAGRIVKSTGDGIVAVFDSPSRAVQCAQVLAGSLGEMDLPVRAGVHTGEVELRGQDIGGVGVHLASRVNDLATSGEVWVSRTVRDLVSGSGIRLEPRGAHALKGFDEEWELYAVSG